MAANDDQASVLSDVPLQQALEPLALTGLRAPDGFAKLEQLGGLERLLHLLDTSPARGIDASDTENRQARFGRNVLPTKKAKSFFTLCLEAMKDKVLILLTVAAVISLALGLYETFGQGTVYDDEHKPLPKVDWVEGVAIIVAVIIVVVVGAVNDYQKERQFAKLNAKKEDRDVVVVRLGQRMMVSIYDLLVGDLMLVETGDILPADGVLLEGAIECDELALTGELETVEKAPGEDIFLISGARVLSGVGMAVVTAVGENSMHGQTMAALGAESELTPLTLRLNSLAEGISKYGFLAALVLFVVLFIRYCVNIAPGGSYHGFEGAEKGKKFLDIIIVAVTIVVVAVPEGLPLAVTLALAFATTRMTQNGNLVRVLRLCETMGGATAICLDKTGTLTENRMRVVAAFARTEMALALWLEEMAPEPRRAILENIVVNSTAFANPDYDEARAQRARERPKKQPLLFQFFANAERRQREQQAMGVVAEPYLGNKTESALLILAGQAGHFAVPLAEQRRAARVVQVIPFESSRKWLGVVVEHAGGFRLYVKGAAEIVVRLCAAFPFDVALELYLELARGTALEKIDEYAMAALRAIMLAHRDYEAWDGDADAVLARGGLTMDALFGIQDPLKPGVALAVERCKQAGVTVRMVTGDNLATAKAILRGCNILTPADLDNEHALMEGPAFRALTPEQRAQVAPQLRVLARLLPEDKRVLVETLRKAGEVVAVTGDGTNDAPALKLADVGFSMGILGTEVAREALDIILMTDDFADIVEAIKWGRTVAESIKKFIQFQLTVNITACVLTFVSAVASLDGLLVLTAVQLLWVNLIMDTMAALALATDKPDDALLHRKPAGRRQPLILVLMWKMILGQALMQLAITFVLHFAGKRIFFGLRPIDNHTEKQLDAMTFNTFVWLQFWKLFVTRKLDEAADVRRVRDRISAENLNFFQHLLRNWYFIVIAAIIGGVQVLIMFVGGAAFSIVRQTPAQWGTAIVCGFLLIPVGALIRIVPNHWVVAIFPKRAFATVIYYVGFEFLSKERRAQRDLEKGEELSLEV